MEKEKHWHTIEITKDEWVSVTMADGTEIGLGDLGVDCVISDARGQNIEQLLTLAKPHLRELTYHSDGSVIAKSGANAPHPKKLYSANPKAGELSNWGNLTKVSLKKLLKENNPSTLQVTL